MNKTTEIAELAAARHGRASQGGVASEKTSANRPILLLMPRVAPPRSGIGLGIATDLLKEGYFVFANGRSADRLEKAFAELKKNQDVRQRLV